MSDFNWTPDYDMSMDEEIRVRAARFGEGYEQRAPDGLNPLTQKLSLTFTRRPSVIDQIVTFLRARRGGQAFTFTPTGQTEIKVKCLKWKRTWADFGNHKLTLEMERVYE